MQDGQDNNSTDALAKTVAPTPPPKMPHSPAPQAEERSAKNGKSRRDMGDLPVEVVQAKVRNPANPYSYLTPQERAERLAKLWHEMSERLNAAATDKSQDSPS
ncbi:MAG: hypothetical protein HS108_14335 [Planctomycetes bacterium]|nr:hypothetical protein [Planctomycetota bacterium]